MVASAAIDADSLQPTLLSISIIFVTLSTVTVLLRLFTRSCIIKIIGPDDATIIISQTLSILVSVLTILEAVFGLGKHTWTVPPDSALKSLECLYSNVLLYNAAQIVLKISLLIQFRRIFPGKIIQKVCYYLLIFISAWGVTQEIAVGLVCTPLSTIRPHMAGHCISTLPVWYLTSSMNIVTDFIIFATPLPSVIKLQLGFRKKMFLLGLFSLGFFTCIISLVRISTLEKGIHTTDPFWDNAPAAYWSIVELNCGILCASLPTLRPLISRLVPHFLTSHSVSGTSDYRTGTIRDSVSDDRASRNTYIGKELDTYSTSELRKGVPLAYLARLEEGISLVEGVNRTEVSSV